MSKTIALAEEGDKCPNCGPDCCGRLRRVPDDECTCHIAPPCWACVHAKFVCDDCGEELEPPK